MTEHDFLEQLAADNCLRQKSFPSRETTDAFIKRMFHFLFLCTDSSQAQTARERYRGLQQELVTVLQPCASDVSAEQAAATFFAAIPDIYRQLQTDAHTVLRNDPAAKCLDEVLVSYPGFYATAVYRMAHQLWLQGLHLAARLFSAHAHCKTGIDIHPGARIGNAFSMDHGTGIVIGETACIGNNVSIFQGVTLGALQVAKEQAWQKRHPTIEDNVIIYAGATILGGKTVVGRNSIIGGNVWLTESVLSGSIVYHLPSVKIRSKALDKEVLHFEI